MKIKSKFALLVAAGAAFAAGAVHAAVVPIEQSLHLHMPPGDLVYNIATDGGPDSTTSYYELVVAPSWTAPTKFTTFSTEPVGTSASYALYVDTNPGIEAGNTGAPLDSWAVMDIVANNNVPFHTALLSPGQYILQLTTLPNQYSISTRISAVPLPGALWLFGTALLTFLGFSQRRRI